VDVVQRIQRVVAQVLRVPIVQVKQHSALADLAALDSLKLVEVLAALDDEFRTHVSSDGITVEVSVGDLVRLVEQSPSR
jgi:acyl carrier protein